MPWFPDFVSAVELSRRQTRAAGQADPVGQYFAALNSGHVDALETIWPGEVVVYDPRAGEIRGHKQLKHFVARNQSWLSERNARIETVATTTQGGRAVVELLAHLADEDGQVVAWPVAVVAESPDEGSVVFRTYCSQWPVDGRRHVRPPVLDAAIAVPNDVVGRYEAAFAAGDVDAIVSTFAPDGYLRESFGPRYTHRGSDELRAFFREDFSAPGGIGIECCAMTDDDVRCVLEYNCVSWGSQALAPQAGLAVFERATDGLLAAVRVYDDIEAPTASS